MTARAQRGLTLPELLIALLIFAMISGVSVYALRLAVEGREQLETADATIRDMQIARLIIKQDLGGVAMRVVRDEFGAPYPSAFIGGVGLAFRRPVDGETLLLAFVRRGWDNPGEAAPRASLQAVEYLLVGDKLVRRARPYLDDAAGQPRAERVLIDGVSEASIYFYAGEVNGRFDWSEMWPRGCVGATCPPPKAIRMSLTTKRYGALEQLFWIGEFKQ